MAGFILPLKPKRINKLTPTTRQLLITLYSLGAGRRRESLNFFIFNQIIKNWWSVQNYLI